MRQKKIEAAEFEIDFGELIYVLWKKAWVIVLVTVIFASSAFAYANYTAVDMYKSTSKIFILPKSIEGEYNWNTFALGRNFINDTEQIVKSNYVLEQVIEKMDLDIPAAQLADMISISTTDNTSVLSLSVTANDPYLARDLANTVTEIAKERIKEIFQVDSLNVVDNADLPLQPIGSGIKKTTLMGAVAGFAIPSVIIAAIHLFNNTIVIPDDVENYLDLSVLGVIPYDDGKKKRHSKKKRIKARIKSRNK